LRGDGAGGRRGRRPILRAVTLPGRVVVYDGDAHGFDVPDPLAIAAEAGAAATGSRRRCRGW
jgi:hypothetical protein